MISFLNYLKKTYKLNDSISDYSILKHRTIYKEWVAQIKTKKTPLELELPWITILAKQYIEQYFLERGVAESKVFEYGSGGSSLFFLKYASEVHSVEHDEAWFNRVQKSIADREIKGWNGYFRPPEYLEDGRGLKLKASNPNHYYTNAQPYLQYHFEGYVKVIDGFRDNYFDIVLIDGRSRPSCISHSLKKVKKGGLLILDNAERKYYLEQKLLYPEEFSLELAFNSALICCDQFTQTNIYFRK